MYPTAVWWFIFASWAMIYIIVGGIIFGGYQHNLFENYLWTFKVLLWPLGYWNWFGQLD
jgi:hypothetical protein